jgi:hypothetical protein
MTQRTKRIKLPRSKKARRLLQLESLYQRHYCYLRELAESRFHDVREIEWTCKLVVQFLPHYPKERSLEDQAFREWASAISDPERGVRFQELYLDQKNHKYMLKAIWSVLKGAIDLADDPDFTAEDIASGVWNWVLVEGLESLLDSKSTAEVSTRLWIVAYWAARRWKTDRLRERAYHNRLQERANVGEEPEERDDDVPEQVPPAMDGPKPAITDDAFIGDELVHAAA